MSHLHIPDGVLPLWLWGSGLALALLVLVLCARRERGALPRDVAWRAALGGVMLAAMAVELPLGPIEYHLSLIGPVGVLAGPAASFPLVFIVSLILAFVGHGGFTVVGWNALVLGAGAAIARPVYRACVRATGPAAAMALATAASQAIAGGMWLGVMAIALRVGATPVALRRVAMMGGFALPLWIGGILIESAVAYGLGRFLQRVRPDLLPSVPERKGSAS